MPQPVRTVVDDAGQAWLVLDNGHRLRIPGGGGNGGSGGGGTAGNEVTIHPEQPSDGSELWLDLDAEAEPITGGPDEVAIQTAEPVEHPDLWVDTDEPGGPQLMFWDGTQYVPILGGISQADADARYVQQAGDAMSGGLGFGSAVASSPTDVTRHLALYGASYGLNVTANTLNYVAPANYFHHFHGKEVSLETGGAAIRLTPVEGTPNRYLMMRDASNGQPGVRFTQDAAGTSLAPLAVLDPGQPEHAATKNYVDPTLGSVSWSGVWVPFTSSYVEVMKHGGMVTLNFLIKPTSDTALSSGTTVTLGVVAAGFRPVLTGVYTNCSVQTSGSTFVGGHLWVEGAAGAIKIRIMTNGTVPAASGSIGCSITYRQGN